MDCLSELRLLDNAPMDRHVLMDHVVMETGI
jgi:hypothetical protein